MGRGTEQTFFQRRHTDGQQVHEEMLNITYCQGNATQNHSEILLHTGYNGIIKTGSDNKCWRGCREKGIFVRFWWECILVQLI